MLAVPLLSLSRTGPPRDAHVLLAGDDARPRMLVSQSCSGSSFVGAVIADFITAAGWTPYPGNAERLNPSHNQFYEASLGMAAAFRQMHAQATALDQPLYIKAFAPQLISQDESSHGEVPKALADVGVQVAAMWRENVLDRAVCLVTDCIGIGNNLGHPVDAQASFRPAQPRPTHVPDPVTPATLDAPGSRVPTTDGRGLRPVLRSAGRVHAGQGGPLPHQGVAQHHAPPRRAHVRGPALWPARLGGGLAGRRRQLPGGGLRLTVRSDRRARLR